MFNGETGRGRIGCESATPNVLHSDRRKNTQDKQFFPLFSEFHGKPAESDKNREGGRQHIRSTREGWNLLLLATVYSYSKPLRISNDNKSCGDEHHFLGTDISKQHHCVVLLLHFTRILWLFLVVACPHTFFFLIYFTRLHVSPYDVLLLLYFRR